MDYKVTIGLEMHCEISNTKTKVFSPSTNNNEVLANQNVNCVDIALPGTLPTVNNACVKDAIMMATILNCEIPKYMYFERKNYYYPDLPKGYQITQNTNPIPVGSNGSIEVEREDGTTFTVEIDNIHLEEDSAQMTHFGTKSSINYNRAGIPLLELVTKPCLHSADDAIKYLEVIRGIYQYTNISEADSKKGQIRCDVNVSVSKTDILGVKVETKNVNSFSAVRDVIGYEVKRQIECIENNIPIEQETRRWNEEKMCTEHMRSKVDAIDYRYFVEPNIPKFLITEEFKEEIKNEIPELAFDRKKKYMNEYGLSNYDATIIVKEKTISDYYEECLKLGIDSKSAANWLIVNIIGYLNKEYLEISEFYLTPKMLKTILDKVNDGTISSKQAKEVFNKVLEEKKDPENFISADNAQISDENELTTIIDNIVNNNGNMVEQYKNGKSNLFEFFVGQVMKETKGKANPVKTREILHQKLD